MTKAGCYTGRSNGRSSPSEACLTDVDARLVGQGYTHTRYVDDFRVFCSSRKAAVGALHDLTEYLYTAHRLSLQSLKTRILDTATFVAQEMRDPAKLEEQTKAERLNALIEQIENQTGYVVHSIDDLEDDTLQGETRDNIRDLFNACVSSDILHLGLARYLLRRAARMRTRVIYPLLFDRLEALAPIMRDVVIYLQKTMSDKAAAQYGPLLVDFLWNNDLGGLPFVRLWGLYLLEQRPVLAQADEAWRIAEDTRGCLGIRPLALLARQQGRLDWVRSQKEVWANCGPWDRRAIIWSGSILPRDERRAWFEIVEESPDLLDRAVAQFAHSSAEAKA